MHNKKSGFVSIIGRPNVGKSTLLNLIVDDKITIISDKPQTTRTIIRGIYNDDNSQIVFVDTPGIQTPRNELGKFMEKSSEKTISDTDLILFIVDESDYIGRKDKDIIEKLKKTNTKKFLVINKVDKINNAKLIEIIQMYDELKLFDEIIPISALKNKNKENLLKVIKANLKEGPVFFSENQTTDQPVKVLISEIIREKVLHYTDEEIPHGVMVEIESLKEYKNNTIEIMALIFVERENHKKIIIGKGGRKIKGIGMSARKELEERFEAKINLQLWVKVKSNWRDNKQYVRNFGFDDRSIM